MGRILDAGRVFHKDGIPAAGGTAVFYKTGTTTKKTTHSDPAYTVDNSNPMTLGSDGRLPAETFGIGSYTIRVTDVNGALIWAENDVQPQVTDITNVVYYNATGDGVTDDAVACQTALSIGGNVTFPSPGTYLIGTTLSIPSNTRVVIEAGASVKAKGSLDGHIFTNSDQTAGNTNISFLGGGTINGNKANQTASASSSAIYLVKSNYVDIGHLYIHDTNSDGVHLDNGTQGVYTTHQTIHNLNIIDAGTTSGTLRRRGIRVTNANGLEVRDCYIEGAEEGGIGASGKYVNISGCVVRTSDLSTTLKSAAYTMDGNNGVSHWNLTNCVSIGCGTGIRINGDVTVTGAVNISNCQFIDSQYSGIFLNDGIKDIQISNSLFVNNGRSAVAVAVDDGRAGIDIKPGAGMTAVDISIIGCRFYDDDATTQVEGIYMQGATSRVLIDDCNFTGSTQATRNASTGTGIEYGSKNIGSNLYAKAQYANLAVTTSATTTETTMHAITFLADEIVTSTVLEFEYWLQDTYSAGATHTYRLKCGAVSYDLTVTPTTSGPLRISGFIRFDTDPAEVFVRLHQTPSTGAQVGQIKRGSITLPTLSASWIFSLTAQTNIAAGYISLFSARVRPV